MLTRMPGRRFVGNVEGGKDIPEDSTESFGILIG